MLFHHRRTKTSLKMSMTRSVVQSIKRELGGRPPEAGGMLGGSADDQCIPHFYFDHSARTSGSPTRPTISC
jgi:hypothetical protein